MTDIAELQDRLWQEILAKASFKNPDAMYRAFLSAPRHGYVDTYRTLENKRWRQGPIEEIYTDASLFLIGDDDKHIYSSTSEPSYILSLLDWLDLRPGQRVLEVGSGSGWLLAIMAHLVGPAGHVTGIEIIPSLAEASRSRLQGLGVSIVRGDGTFGFTPNAPYDRVIFTAAMAEPPVGFVSQMRHDGLIIAPICIESWDDSRSDVRLFRVDGEKLQQIGNRSGYFVPLRSMAA